MKKKILFVSALVLSLALYSCGSKSTEEIVEEEQIEEVVDTDEVQEDEIEDNTEDSVVEEVKSVVKKEDKSAEEKAKEIKEKAEKEAIDRLNTGKGKGTAKTEATEEELIKAAEKKQAEENILNRQPSKSKGNR